MFSLNNRQKIFNYPDAELAAFSTEISVIKNCQWQDCVGLELASCHDL